MFRLHPDDIKTIIDGIAAAIMAAKQTLERFVNVDELCEIIGVPKPTVYMWSQNSYSNGFPCSKAGKKVTIQSYRSPELDDELPADEIVSFFGIKINKQ